MFVSSFPARTAKWRLALIIAALTPVCVSSALIKAPREELPSQAGQQIVSEFSKLPLSFEANWGQYNSQVKFLSRGRGYTLFLTANEAVLTLQQPLFHGGVGDGQTTDTNGSREGRAAEKAVLRMKLLGSNADPEVMGLEELPGAINYFIGNDPAKWRTNISSYAKVKFEDVYPGTDLVYYGNQQQLEYDFIVSPGADPGAIRLSFDGAKMVKVDDNGELVLHINSGEVRLNRPVIYQETGYERLQIKGGYEVVERPGQDVQNLVTFQIAAYDVTSPLIIDPVLVYSTYVGGSDLDASLGTNDLAVDSDGNVLIVGGTKSIDFPTLNAVQSTLLGSPEDAFVTKLNADGSGLIFSTYFGGSTQDGTRNPSTTANSIVLDSQGNAYVTGTTVTPDFPTTAGAFQPAYSGGGDAFVLKLSANGALVYSSFVGGGASDRGNVIAVDSNGNAYIAGQGNGQVPTTTGAFQEVHPGGSAGFITKINAAGSALTYSTHLGGTAFDAPLGLAVDAFGNAFVVGVTFSTDFPTTPGAFQTSPGFEGNAFVTKLNANGSGLFYSTYLGGDGTPDAANDIAVDAAGNAYVTGQTRSTDFPTTAGAFQENIVSPPVGGLDAFVTKLNANGSDLIYSTYIGDRNQELGSGLALNSDESVFVTIDSNGFALTHFPLVEPLPEFQALLPCAADGAVVRLDASGSTLLFSTLLGGCANDFTSGVVVDSAGNAYVAGVAGSNDFPTTPGVFQPSFQGGVSDSFVVKIAFAPTLACSGFEPPMDNGPVTVRKNKVLPLKAQLVDNGGTFLTDLDLVSSPVIQVLFDSGAGSAIDVTDDALPAGQGTEGNQFEFGTDKWQYNLKTKNYTAAGTYTVTMESGNVFEYKVDSCETQFVIKP